MKNRKIRKKVSPLLEKLARSRKANRILRNKIVDLTFDIDELQRELERPRTVQRITDEMEQRLREYQYQAKFYKEENIKLHAQIQGLFRQPMMSYPFFPKAES